jgi:hypothetical protein
MEEIVNLNLNQGICSIYVKLKEFENQAKHKNLKTDFSFVIKDET